MHKTKNIAILFLFVVVYLGNIFQAKAQNSADVSIMRLDKDFQTFLSKPTKSEGDKLVKKYPSLFPAFGQITVGKMIDNDTTAFYKTLTDYFSHPELKKVYIDEQKKFKDIATYEKELSEAKAIAASLLPDRQFPRVAMHVSGFKENIIIIDGIISLSAEKYMGSDYGLYQSFFPADERFQMAPEFITRDYLKAWILGEDIIKTEDKQTLISAMVEQGKLLFLLSKLLPDSSPSDIAGFTQPEIEWFEKNEARVWKAASKGNTLFSTQRQVIGKYMDERGGMADSPKQVGALTGWRIVEQYARNTGITAKEILAKDTETILKGAKYKP
ncbi:hypothetical protein [Dysgonomonas sp. 25]|uniref:gliding motility protein GldB-related protein n=1 Tax=Dysgonomonas sp. 25 TaxID=2302933 RepID=UPI0013D35787|nr:hypothetical protein [Dysgonomonas sp. 25]NDV67665.1 hypothetical protein [Dysgonomonas sp. 25]